MKLSKKDHAKKKPTRDEGHWEGKYWCNCMIRNFRGWLGLKKYGGMIALIKEWQEEDEKEDNDDIR